MAKRNVGQLVAGKTVVTLLPGTTVREACRVMAQNQIGAVVVIAGGELEGIFTERDALNRVLATGQDPDTMALSEAMTPNVVTVGSDTSAADALRLMTDIGFRHLPVVDENERISGIVSLRDFIGVELEQGAPKKDD